MVNATRALAPTMAPTSAAARARARGLPRPGERPRGFGPRDGAALSGGAGDGPADGLGHPAERRGGPQGDLLGRGDDAAHRLHGLDRILPDAGLAGEHDGV